MDASLDRSVSVPEDVVFRELQGEAVILNLESSMYFGLDPIGTRIWQLLETHRSLRAVCDAMEQEFDAPADALKSDLLTLVDELAKNGLLRVQ